MLCKIQFSILWQEFPVFQDFLKGQTFPYVVFLDKKVMSSFLAGIGRRRRSGKRTEWTSRRGFTNAREQTPRKDQEAVSNSRFVGFHCGGICSLLAPTQRTQHHFGRHQHLLGKITCLMNSSVTLLLFVEWWSHQDLLFILSLDWDVFGVF